MTIRKRDKLSPGDDPPHGAASGFTCPRCGGSMWETAGESLGFRCRIGHDLSLGGMLAEHGWVRRAKLIEAGRLLAEAAALNRRIAGYAYERGHAIAAAQLEREAAVMERRADEVVHLSTAALVDTSPA